MAKTSMDVIKQTYRTIIFEEFNSEADSLATLISVDENLNNSDSMKEKISGFEDGVMDPHKGLEVHSFDEFLEKFAPCIYEVANQDEKGNLVLTYQVKKPQSGDVVPIKVKDLPYFKMLVEMYQKKGTSNKNNLEFDSRKVLEMMLPSKEIERAVEESKTLQLIQRTIEENRCKRINSDNLIRQRNAIRREIIERYKVSKSALIPIAIQDIDRKIATLTGGGTSEKLLDKSGSNLELALFGFNEEGMPIPIPIPSGGETSNLPVSDSNAKTLVPFVDMPKLEQQKNCISKIAKFIESDIDTNIPNCLPCVKNWIISVYSGKETDRSDINLASDELKRRKGILLQLYTKQQQNMLDAVNELISKIFEIRVFFDHATAKGGNDGKMVYPVLIANCKIGKLLGKNKDRFAKFIESKERETGHLAYWFAVIPNVTNRIEGDLSVDDEDEKPIILEQSDNGSYQIVNDSTSIDDVREAISILKESKITTIFNIKGSNETGFSGLSKEKIQEYREFVTGIDTPFAVFAYPNFTVLNSRGFDIDEEKSGNYILNFPGVFVGASYVAAGLLIASQQHDCLVAKGLSVDNKNVCTRIDLEDSKVHRALLTKFNREMEHMLREEIINEIGKDSFGFVFFSDRKYDGDFEFQNSYVYQARNLEKKDNGKYEPIYRSMMRNFLSKYVDSFELTEDTIKENVLGPITTWCRDSNDPAKEKNVNNVLHKGEKIEFDSSTKELILSLSADKDKIKVKVKDNRGEKENV